MGGSMYARRAGTSGDLSLPGRISAELEAYAARTGTEGIESNSVSGLSGLRPARRSSPTLS